jgi:FAD/FMN-containing dehydrogenase/Fe-S oxidoreductase
MNNLLHAFLTELKQSNVAADIHTDWATRLCLATDNSMHKLLPAAVIYPHNFPAIQAILLVCNKTEYNDISITAKGGGSSTCGQALTDSIVLDCSKYLNIIISMDLEHQTVTVQPGVLLNQLQNALRKHDYYFPVNISSSAQASLGGMLQTDAAGIGSAITGRMHDNLVAAKYFCADGSELVTSKNATQDIEHIPESIADNAHKKITQILQEYSDQISEKFNDIPRHLGGYNIFDVHDLESPLHNLLCGSEGTLAICYELTLNIKPISNHIITSTIFYKNHTECLEHAIELKSMGALAIEWLDENLAKVIDSNNTAKPCNIIIAEWDTTKTHIEHIENLANHIYISNITINTTEEEIQQSWNLRKNAVAFASRIQENDRTPIPFIEDMAVNPDNFKEFVAKIKSLLATNAISYAMYGHLDAGCLHLRPLLNIYEPSDLALLDTITKECIKILKDLNGTLCGEHGHGYRSAYIPAMFGQELYPLLQKIKQLFDPKNKLNPGKIVNPNPSGKVKKNLDDMQPKYLLNNAIWQDVIRCNGSAYCLNKDLDKNICPSFHALNDISMSPKGRAKILSEYGCGNLDAAQIAEIKHSLANCLNCKACLPSGCPTGVNIPRAKAYFNAQENTKSLRNYILSNVEDLIYKISNNFLLSKLYNRNIISKFFKLNNLPRIYQQQQVHNKINHRKVAKLNPEKDIIIIQDICSTNLDPGVLNALINICNKVGINYYVLPHFNSGANYLSHGKIAKFKRIMAKNNKILSPILAHKIPVICIEPSINLMFRDEYKSFAYDLSAILLPQEWLSQKNILSKIKQPDAAHGNHYHLWPHCHEQALAKQSITLWPDIFQKLGIDLTIHNTACCGMAGAFGLLEENSTVTAKSFDLHVKPTLPYSNSIHMATGYSCRQQMQIMAHRDTSHPLCVISQLL